MLSKALFSLWQFFFVPYGPQQILAPILYSNTAASVPVYNWTVIDWSACTSGSTPTTGCLGSSTFAGAAGSSWATVGTTANITATNSIHKDLLTSTVKLTNGSNYLDSGNLSLQYATGTATTTAEWTFAAGNTTTADCGVLEHNIAQNVTTFGRMDNSLITTVSDFITEQLTGTGSVVALNVESAGSGGEIISGSGTVISTSTPYIACRQLNPGATHYFGLWNYSTGALIISATAAANNSNNAQKIAMGSGSGSGIGPTGGDVWFGQWVLSYDYTASAFPLVPSSPGVVSLQLPTPTVSPSPTGYSTSQTVNFSDIANGYTFGFCSTVDGSTPTASGGSCTHGSAGGSTTVTLNGGSTSIVLNVLAMGSGFAPSALFTGTYTYVTNPVSANNTCNNHSFGATSLTCVFPNTTQSSSSYLVVHGLVFSAGATITLTASGGSLTWAHNTIAHGGGATAELMWAPTTGAASVTATVTSANFSSGDMEVTGNEYKGATGIDVNSVETLTGSIGSGSTITCPSVTTTNANDLVVCGLMDPGLNGNAYTATGTGYAIDVQSASFGQAIESGAKAVAGAIAPTATYSGTATHMTATIAFHP